MATFNRVMAQRPFAERITASELRHSGVWTCDLTESGCCPAIRVQNHPFAWIPVMCLRIRGAFRDSLVCFLDICAVALSKSHSKQREASRTRHDLAELS
jgi:hypothetical protein